jgi:L-amino acid N-acyltransferase YncA
VDDGPPAGLTVRPLLLEDWPAVRAIFAEGIASGHATFETEPPEWDAWDRAHTLRLVADADGDVVGWAALSPVSHRPAYRGVAEDSVYVASAARGRGVGRILLQELVARADADGTWTVQAAIFPENEASIALHERCGFRVVGIRDRLGCLRGAWRDVVLMERRRIW